jgi:type 1 fimbria pilin
MKNVMSSIVAAVFAVALVAPLGAADNTTVKGEVVDLACSLSKGEGGKGEAHAACAMSCAKRGNQMAILATDEVYLIEGDYSANNNARLLDFVAKRIEAKGDVTEKDGKKVINVASMMVAK